MEKQVYAGYRQFHLIGDPTRADTSDALFWTEEAYRDRLAVGPFVIAVGTDTCGNVPVSIDLRSSPSVVLPDNWDHIVDSRLEVPYGMIELAGCPDPEPVATIKVIPGTYCVRICFRGLTTSPDDGGVWNGDSYLVEIWQGDSPGRSVVKRFRPT